MGKRRSPQPRLVWAYCRVSTLKTDQELSLEEQIRWSEDFARQRGAALKLFKERASAKTVVGRPQCARLLGLLEGEEQDIPEFVIATSFDRLSRDITDTMVIARALKRAGVKLYIRDRGEIGMESFGDQAALVGQAMGGHAENEAKSSRCKASWQRRQREGKPMSNKSPYGLQLKAERDVEEPTTGPWVRQAFELYASGIGAHTIAKRMKIGAPPHRVVTSKRDAEGEPIVRVRAHVWEYNRVLKMLKQTRYCGTLVDPELFERVQEILRSRPHWRQDRVHEYPLSGAIKCLHCGRSFHGHATGGTSSARRADGTVQTYRRSKRVRYYGCIVCNYMINAEQLESWFGETIRKIEAEPKLVDQWIATGRMTNTQDMVRERRVLEMRVRNGSFDTLRQRAWQLALSDDAVAVDLPRQLRSINDEEGRCRDRLAEIADLIDRHNEATRDDAQARALLRNFRALYEAATYDQQRELAHAAVQSLGGCKASKSGLVWNNAHSGHAIYATAG
jgi:DNA invertase Pin-like site-specific DNA recombinase